MVRRIRSRWAVIPLLLAPASAVFAATSTTAFRLKGETATATFEAFDPQDSCLLDFVSVTASDIVEKTSPGGKKTGSPGTVLIVNQRDVCRETILIDAVDAQFPRRR